MTDKDKLEFNKQMDNMVVYFSTSGYPINMSKQVSEIYWNVFSEYSIETFIKLCKLAILNKTKFPSIAELYEMFDFVSKSDEVKPIKLTKKEKEESKITAQIIQEIRNAGLHPEYDEKNDKWIGVKKEKGGLAVLDDLINKVAGGKNE